MQVNEQLGKEKHVVSREMRITNLIRPEDQTLAGVQKLNTLCSQWLEVAAQGRREGKKLVVLQQVHGELSGLMVATDCVTMETNDLSRILATTDNADLSDKMGLPRELCGLPKGSFAIVLRLAERPDLIISSATRCDDQSIVAEMLTWLGYPIYTVEMPLRRRPIYDEEYFYTKGGVAYNQQIYDMTRSEILALKKKLEELTGKEITPEDLRQAIKKVNYIRELARKILSLRKADPTPLSAVVAMWVQSIPSHNFGNPDGVIDAYETLIRDIEERIRKKEGITVPGAKRVLWSAGRGIDLNIYNLIEDSGATVLGWSIPCQVYYAIEGDPDPIHSLTLDVINYTNLSTESKLDRLRSEVKEYDLQGAIFSTYFGCSEWPVVSMIEKEEMMKLGLQTLIFEMFFPGQRAHEQIQTRIRAFVEIMEQKRFAPTQP